MVSALLIQGVPVECINQAAVRYLVPAKVIVSVLQTEGGRPGLAKANTNGTFDYGPMQINSTWLKHITPYGYDTDQIKNDPCVNVIVGTWILSREIADLPSTNYWQAVSDYHSHTPRYNQTYQTQVKVRYAVLSKTLAEAV